MTSCVHHLRSKIQLKRALQSKWAVYMNLKQGSQSSVTLYCERCENNFEDNERQIWRQCHICSDWYHENCENSYFILSQSLKENSFECNLCQLRVPQ